MQVIIDRALDFVSLILVSFSLVFLLRARSALKVNLLRRSSMFLWFIFLVEIIEGCDRDTALWFCGNPG